MQLRDRTVMVLLIAAFLLSQAFWLVFPQSMGWDESVYLGMGKFMFSHGEIGLWEPLRPLLLPLIAGTLWASHLPLYALRIVALIFSATTIICTYLLARRFARRATAAIAALLVLITPVFALHATSFLTGIPSTAFALIALLLTEKHNAKSGIIAALAFLTRFPQALIGISIASSMLFWNRRRFLMFALAGTAVVLPFLLFNTLLYSGMVAPVYPLIAAAPHQANQAYALPGAAAPLFYILLFLASAPVLLLAFPGAILLARRFGKTAFPMLASFTALLLYFSIIPNRQERFALVFLPYAAICAAYAIDRAQEACTKYRIRACSPVLALLLLFSIVLSTSQLLHPVYDRSQPLGQDVAAFLETQHTVLTIDPRFAAYADTRFVPFYDNPAEGARILGNATAHIVVYRENFYPCTDEVCTAQLVLLTSRVEALHPLAAAELGGEVFTIYSAQE